VSGRVAIAVVSVFFLALGWIFRHKLCELVRKHSTVRFLIIAFALAAVAQLLDLGVTKLRWQVTLEENLELNASLAMLFAALAANPARRASLAGTGNRQETGTGSFNENRSVS